MNKDSDREIVAVVEAALCTFADPKLVGALRTFIVSPRRELREWEWGKEPSEVVTWVIAESARYNYGIVFSEDGFGPEQPWGLVFSSHTNIGADYCWYKTLEAAFTDSRLLEEFLELDAALGPGDELNEA
jgi:hypothetical protein